MTKEKITLSSITVDAQILPNNTLDAYIYTEGSSGAHYKGLTAAAVGANVQELIECRAETNLEGTGRMLATSSLNRSTWREMFTHYIERMRKLQTLPADSVDSIRCAGECTEACAAFVDKMLDYLNGASREISEDNLQENSMEALREIVESKTR